MADELFIDTNQALSRGDTDPLRTESRLQSEMDRLRQESNSYQREIRAMLSGISKQSEKYNLPETHRIFDPQRDEVSGLRKDMFSVIRDISSLSQSLTKLQSSPEYGWHKMIQGMSPGSGFRVEQSEAYRTGRREGERDAERFPPGYRPPPRPPGPGGEDEEEGPPRRRRRRGEEPEFEGGGGAVGAGMMRMLFAATGGAAIADMLGGILPRIMQLTIGPQIEKMLAPLSGRAEAGYKVAAQIRTGEETIALSKEQLQATGDFRKLSPKAAQAEKAMQEAEQEEIRAKGVGDQKRVEQARENWNRNQRILRQEFDSLNKPQREVDQARAQEISRQISAGPKQPDELGQRQEREELTLEEAAKHGPRAGGPLSQILRRGVMEQLGRKTFSQIDDPSKIFQGMEAYSNPDVPGRRDRHPEASRVRDQGIDEAKRELLNREENQKALDAIAAMVLGVLSGEKDLQAKEGAGVMYYAPPEAFPY
jgi:hypothetical protein